MVEKIVNDYGKFLDSPAGGAPGYIVDVQILPWPKEQIKQAIFIALDNTSDAMMRNLLVTGLLCLPNYQAGVGETPVDIDHSKFAHITDAQALARAMSPHLEMVKKLEPLVEAEQAELRVALKSRNIVF
jgi:hypothetical protein